MARASSMAAHTNACTLTRQIYLDWVTRSKLGWHGADTSTSSSLDTSDMPRWGDSPRCTIIRHLILWYIHPLILSNQQRTFSYSMSDWCSLKSCCSALCSTILRSSFDFLNRVLLNLLSRIINWGQKDAHFLLSPSVVQVNTENPLWETHWETTLSWKTAFIENHWLGRVYHPITTVLAMSRT